MPLVLPFSTSFKRVAILGGGLTGLTAAYRLARLGHTVRLFEVTDRIGGSIRTEIKDGWLVESGEAALRENCSAVTVLLQAIGTYKHRIEGAPRARRRYIVRHGRLRAAPRNSFETVVSRLIPLGAKLRGLGELCRQSPAERNERTFADLVRRQLGSFAADYIAQSFATGIYFGDATKLSAQYAFPRFWDMWGNHGSFLRAQMDHIRRCYERNEYIEFPVVSFTRGMQTLIHGLTLQLPADVIVPHARVEGLVPGPRWHVIWRDVSGQPGAAFAPWSESDDTGRQVEGFDSVISALPGYALARLAVGDRAAHPLEAVGALEYAPLSSLFLGFRRDQVRHRLRGFGLIAPTCERRSLLGVTFASSIFPGRAPEGHVALNVSVGGSLRPDLAALPTADLVAAVLPDLRDLLGIRGDPVFIRHATWPRAVPQYNLGHGRLLQTIFANERAHPGLFIGGSARDGVSVAQRILAGERLADRAMRYSADDGGIPFTS